MFPSRMLPRHGIFLLRQATTLAPHGITCTFLVARPWAPHWLTRVPRWRVYGRANPLLDAGADPVQAVPYLRPPGHWFRRWEGAAMQRALLPAAEKLHGQEPFDAILACPMIPDAVAAVALSQKLALPLATLSIGSDILVYPRRMPTLEKQLRDVLSQTSLAVGVSKDICKRLEQLGAKQMLCVYLGRDTKLFTPHPNRAQVRRTLSLPLNAMIAVFVGRLTPNKGLEELVQAVHSLEESHPELHLVCVGDGPARHVLKGFGSERVTLAGERPPQEVPSYLQAADFLVLPSHSEGMPQVVLEAMNCGLPVVATRVGGIPEAVTHEQNGLLIEPCNHVQLTAAIKRMVVDKNFRIQAGKQSEVIAKKRFDSQTNATLLAEALKRLSERRSVNQNREL